MQRDRWKEINRIFHAALDISPQDRPGFVATESKDDPDLQSQVERLLQADGLAESYLESPLVPQSAFNAAFAQAFSDHPQLRTGDILCQRFHILRAVGSGGMGQVYEAHDTELAVNVALKLIRPEIAANPQSLARFRQEVRLARRITHPNVCRTYDLERDTLPTPGAPPRSLVFLTMEFLAGETLAERLKRTGPLTPGETLAIARQIAAALDAAHALGIVHRDIKPGNIMLVPPGENSRQPARPSARVVITDFGLARIDPIFSQDELPLTQHTSHSNQPIGTPPYMAPEQLEGHPVSAATDIYAFGLLLFEMATGQRAFPSTNLLTGIAQRLTGQPPSARAIQPNLPDSLEQAIQGCLRRNPEDRFQSAQAVVDCLTGQTRPPEIATIPATNPQSKPNQRFYTRKSLVLAAILPVAVSLFLLGPRFSWWKGNPEVAAGALVYLAPVQNETNDKSLDNITELLQASLEQSAHINLLDQGKAGDILQNMTKPADTPITEPIGREIALRANAARVIFAQVTGSQGHYTLKVDIQRPEYTNPLKFRDHWEKSYTWQVTGNTRSGAPSDIIPHALTSSLRDATEWIRNEVGESSSDIVRLNDPPEDVTTNSWEAFAEYRKAIELNRAQKPAAAVLALKSATQIDPEFALAYGAMADILLTLHRENEGFEAYKRALDPNLDRRLTRRERDRLKGMYAIDSWDFPTAIEAFRDYQTYYPNDPLGWVYPTYPLRMLGRDTEAIENLKRAAKLSPKSANSLTDLAAEDIVVGNLDVAKALIGRANQIEPTGHAVELSASIAFLQGDYSKARDLITSLGNAANSRERSRSFEMLANLDAEQGDYQAAIEALNKGIQDDIAQGNPSAQSAKLSGRAWMDAKTGQFEQCSNDLKVAQTLDPSPETTLTVETVLGQAIDLAPRPVKIKLRRQMIEISVNLPGVDFGQISSILKLRTTGEALLAGGRSMAALGQFWQLSAIEAPSGVREYLGRALSTAASQEPDRKKAKEMELEATEAYAKAALHPERIWLYSYNYPPGFYADQLEVYLQLANEAGDSSPAILEAQQRLKNLRSEQQFVR